MKWTVFFLLLGAAFGQTAGVITVNPSTGAVTVTAGKLTCNFQQAVNAGIFALSYTCNPQGNAVALRTFGMVAGNFENIDLGGRTALPLDSSGIQQYAMGDEVAGNFKNIDLGGRTALPLDSPGIQQYAMGDEIDILVGVSFPVPATATLPAIPATLQWSIVATPAGGTETFQQGNFMVPAAPSILRRIGSRIRKLTVHL